MSELGDFLRAKRAALNPQDVGLPGGGRMRRVPGLRREEVALLADVGVDHYTRLEQGRAAGVSESVLAAIARALRLTDDEHLYLRALAKPPARPRSRTGSQPAGLPEVSVATRALLDGLTATPALVLGRRMDVLAWNPLAAALFLDFGGWPAGRRNLVRLVFLEPRIRDLFPRWEAVAADAVARLRLAAAAHPHDKRLSALIGELSVQDEDFRRWWSGHAVKATDRGRKTFDHPVTGPIELDWQALRLSAHQDQTLIVYTAPPGSSTAEALHFLQAWAPARDTAGS
ncbi:helix-turn-helix transcriptional regulator [Bailinhaonella thermotolerans]|uniref:XRE family transcriptional regulator n=1 Tax=Bailinhaonella thermotolerans TaxID=1070861 RepID=A0A3A4AZS9_9ACTN|nr:helix-turn-helix transcriptional regulator [Bailinhaonella thermotolerans]RJL35907.1 XRE family transcriptional regulator [Bailinhaonella thermotolerans]